MFLYYISFSLFSQCEGAVSSVKKGSSILLLICSLSLCIVLGIFIGRNLRSEYAVLPQNSAIVTDPVPETTTDSRININTASKTQLMELPGIGDIIADRIIAYRTAHGPFQSIEDLMNVEGIGEKKMQQIEIWIRAGE